MIRVFLAAGVAALAIAVPAAAERGGKGADRAQAAKAERGGGNARAAKADRQQARSARANRQARSAKADRPKQNRAARAERRGGGEARLATMRQERGNSNRGEARSRGRNDETRAQNRGRAEQRAANRQNRAEQRAANRPNRVEQRVERQGRDERRAVNRINRADRNDRVVLRDGNRVILRNGDREIVRARDFDRDRFERRFARRGLPAGFVDGCPPGLAKKNPPCIPPGQAKNMMVGEVLPAAFRSQTLPVRLRDMYRDTDDYYYRYGNGYLYRVDRGDNLVSALLPLIGAGLGVGQAFPYSSPNYLVPSRFQSFYPSGGDDYYRYANGYVYEIDRSTGLIEDIIPLLDRGYGVGQMLPASYSYYNVPYQYRSWYADDDDYYYRYAPGAIYQVDRSSSLITAIASLLTGGLSIGQPLPMGYDAYNVPFAYRDRYYDTPDSWYRYSNGHIYQVDPQTRLITAMIDAIV